MKHRLHSARGSATCSCRHWTWEGEGGSDEHYRHFLGHVREVTPLYRLRAGIGSAALFMALLWFPFLSVPAALIAAEQGQTVLAWFFALGFFEAPLIWLLAESVDPHGGAVYEGGSSAAPLF